MSNKINKILIANRGEIVVRIAHTCRELGILTVGIYSEADIDSLHSKVVDEAYYIGASPAKDSYLNSKKIIEIAKTSRADAIHPGYGFLSENADFAELVVNNGLIWIGPPASAIRAMGSKTSARDLMKKSNVPVVPGTDGAISNIDTALKFAETVGFPILLKAAAGGGGKGMRVVYNAQELNASFDAAQREALSAFGNESIYAEKYIENPKHIEVQIFGDNFGNIIYLGERECSVQRRHQKVIEESPSPSLNNSQRKKVGEMAVMAAKACEYVNAGTIECLLDESDNIYFLEMNTRLQVEHPVTEAVTGLDLVKLQIDIANGNQLSLKQQNISSRGHSIEIRIYAEDSTNGFLPSTGKLKLFKIPILPGVRNDIGYLEGGEVSRFYDPMLAKLIVYGENRDSAISKAVNALESYWISGVKTNIPFCRYVLTSEEFKTNHFYTNTIDKSLLAKYVEFTSESADEEDLYISALCCLVNSSSKNVSNPSDQTLKLWKTNAIL